MSDTIPPPDDVPQNCRKSSEISPAVCHGVPSTNPPMCQGVPSPPGVGEAECASECRNVPNSANFDDRTGNDKTNPNRQRPLTDVQLAAARWIVAGFGSSAIARRLGLNHHTVARWKRDPRVVAFVANLRARADAAVVAASAQRKLTSAGGTPRPDGRDSRDVGSTTGANAPAREVSDPVAERIIAQILRERRAR